jgi:hypothetical protein
MNSMNYVGLDVHKKSISYCVRQADGTILREGRIAATRQALDPLIGELPQPWMAGMEATMFTGWIYDHLVDVQRSEHANAEFRRGDSVRALGETNAKHT